MSSDEEIRLRRFMRLMAREIDANAHKGSRAMRLPVRSDVWLAEIRQHVDKLERAQNALAHDEMMRELAVEKCREHAADVANLALFLIDSLGLLEEEPSTVTYGSSIYGEDYR